MNLMADKQSKIIETDKFHPVQLRVFFTMITLYTFYFAANYNLGPATKYIQGEFHLDNSQFGVLFTIFTIGFGLGQFVSGFLGDRYSPKLLMLIGAIGATVANFCFGLSNSMTAFSICWGINALSLSMGWSPGCSILFRWIPRKRWGLFMGLFDAFAFLGGIIVYPIAGFAITYFSWRYAFFIPPILLLVWALVFAAIVKSTPQEAGLKVEWESCEERSAKGKVTLKDYGAVLKNPIINLVALGAVCSQFVRWGLVNWVIKILVEDVSLGGYGLPIVIASLMASAMHWGGALFSIGMGVISDVCFKGSRWQISAIGFLVSGAGLFLIYFLGTGLSGSKFGIFILTLLLFLAGGCIQGVQAPIFNLPGDILGSRLGGTGVGVINGWSYIGASFSGGALGLMMDSYGLTGVMLLMGAISLIGALIMWAVRR